MYFSSKMIIFHML